MLSSDLNILEKYVLSREKKYLNEIKDSGGIKNKFFGLSVHSLVREGNTILIDSLTNPQEIRKKVGKACGIEYSTWKIERGPVIQTGKGRGVFCDANYGPINSNTYSIAIKGKN